MDPRDAIVTRFSLSANIVMSFTNPARPGDWHQRCSPDGGSVPDIPEGGIGMARVGDLEIAEDIEFQRHQWAAQRIAAIGMAAVIILAALGLFGTGVLSAATVGDADGPLSLDYERFVRREGQATLAFRIAPDQVSGGQIQLWIDAGYMSAIDVEQVTPEPADVQTQGDRLVFVFTATASTGPHAIAISMRPQDMGRLRGEAGIVDGATIAFTQVVYP